MDIGCRGLEAFHPALTQGIRKESKPIFGQLRNLLKDGVPRITAHTENEVYGANRKFAPPGCHSGPDLDSMGNQQDANTGPRAN